MIRINLHSTRGMSVRCNHVLAVLLVGTMSLACSPGLKTIALNDAALSIHPTTELGCLKPEENVIADVGLLADTQLNNYYGARLRTQSKLADRVARVAARPPALDLFSDAVLSAFLREMAGELRAAATTTQRPPLFLFLGDATNTACTGELSRFFDIMSSKENGGITWLMVHGNHDSFMMGNFNVYRRGTNIRDAARFISPFDDVREVSHSDSDWTAAESRMFAYDDASCTNDFFWSDGSWAAACAEPDTESVPTYKGAWLRRYLSRLESQGVELEVDGRRVSAKPGGELDAARCLPPRRVQGRGAVGHDLTQRSFRLSGEIYARSRVDADDECSFAEEGANSYLSYVVQSFDLTPRIRAILIDTDHRDDTLCPWWNRPHCVPNRAAGVVGRMANNQLDEIALHVKAAKDQRVVFFGHHPLGELEQDIQHKLMAHKPLAYISAHTHYASSVLTHAVHGGRFLELNVGSTTDWPMETMLLDASTGELRWRVLGLRTPQEVLDDERALNSSGPAASVCGYKQVRFYVGEEECKKKGFVEKDPKKYMFYKDFDDKYHNLCLTRQALKSIHARWPCEDTADKQCALFDPLKPTLDDADFLREGTNWLEPARSMSDVISSLRYKAMLEGSAQQTFAICEAAAASKVEGKSSQWADHPLPRTATIQSAALFSRAKVQ
jgi:hypothetical protein